MTTKKCTEASFWKAIDSLNWGVRCAEDQSYDLIAREISTKWDAQFRQSFETMLRAKVSELQKTVLAHSLGAVLGDDSLSDLLYHIVGLGKKEYDAVLANPKQAIRRAKTRDYVESFAYCFIPQTIH